MAEVLPPDARQRELENADPGFEDDFDPELDEQGQIGGSANFEWTSGQSFTSNLPG
jgi:hypothetical protein